PSPTLPLGPSRARACSDAGQEGRLAGHNDRSQASPFGPARFATSNHVFVNEHVP
ncbi:hypothetical protein TorRG33x02_100360, partial [Trema orientale]